MTPVQEAGGGESRKMAHEGGADGQEGRRVGEEEGEAKANNLEGEGEGEGKRKLKERKRRRRRRRRRKRRRKRNITKLSIFML